MDTFLILLYKQWLQLPQRLSCLTNSCPQVNLSVKMWSTVLDQKSLIMPKEAPA